MNLLYQLLSINNKQNKTIKRTAVVSKRTLKDNRIGVITNIRQRGEKREQRIQKNNK